MPNDQENKGKEKVRLAKPEDIKEGDKPPALVIIPDPVGMKGSVGKKPDKQ